MFSSASTQVWEMQRAQCPCWIPHCPLEKTLWDLPQKPVCFFVTFMSPLIWPWNCFFLLSILTSCLFLMTHFWETAPETIISGFIHKGQRRQLHPAHTKRGKNPIWALASHCNCALFPPPPLPPFLLPWQCPLGVRARPSISFLHSSFPPSLVSRRAPNMQSVMLWNIDWLRVWGFIWAICRRAGQGRRRPMVCFYIFEGKSQARGWESAGLGAHTALALPGLFFNVMITNISQIRNGKGHINKENMLMSWYVWFRGEFFFQ